jgi:hypothetical protein
MDRDNMKTSELRNLQAENVRPAAFADLQARAAPGRAARIEGFSSVVYDPGRDRFLLSRDPAVNYKLFATRG